MSLPKLTDQQHHAAVESAGRNTVLTSGAGCGKTAVLANRFAELLRLRRDDENPLAALVALTFTDKAALQMRQRLARLLEDLAAGADADDRVRVRRWIDQLPEARITTIHSFCTGLLRSHAIAAGVDPAFTVLADELVAGQMCDDAIRRAVLAAVESGDEDVAKLLARYSFENVTECVGKLVDWRTSYRCDDYADVDATIARWRQLVDDERAAAWDRLAGDAAVAAELVALADLPCADPTDKLAVAREERLALARAILTDPHARTEEALTKLSGRLGGIGSNKNWADAGGAKAVRHRLKAFCDRFEPYLAYCRELADADRLAAESLATLTRLADRAERFYTDAKRARGALDFVDLLACTDRLLAADPTLRTRLAEQIDQLLIDECQDTDAFQMGLLARLIGGDTDTPPAEGRLFVVGDVKQSIYRFRGAQIEVFRDLCHRLGPDSHQSLSTSFRTHAAGIAWINSLFSPLMGDAYEPIRAHRTDQPPGPSVEILLAAGDEPLASASDAVAAQAAVTAARIRDLVDSRQPVVWDADARDYRPADYRDIAILFARMTHSLDFERHLAAQDIPYYVVAGSGFFHQQEIYDVLNALRVIDNPFNDIALVGALRSSLVGLDDNALMHLAQTCRPPYLPALPSEALAGRLPPAMAEALAEIVALIRRLHGRKDAVGIDGLIDSVLDATGYEATLLTQLQGARKVGNVRLLIAHARSAAAEGMSLANFITQMDRLTLADARYEQAAVAGEGDNVVRLMTIHKAKGLEFPVVVVPDLNVGKTSPRGRLLNRPDWGLTFNPPIDGLEADEVNKLDNQPLSFHLARQREKQDDADETIRKYYVALTRHRDHLILVGADLRGSDGQLKESGSFLAQMDAIFGLTDAIDAGGEQIDYTCDGQTYPAIVRRTQAKPSRRRRRQATGDKLLAKSNDGGDFGQHVLTSAGDDAALPLVGPLPPTVGRIELPVTALCDFVHCPMLYRWRYELRVPTSALPKTEPASDSEPSTIDAATAGTFFHRCMELMDFAAPQSAGQLADRSAAEMELSAEQTAILTGELADMLDTFKGHDLYQTIAASQQTFRELDFVLSAGPATLRGQIDLLLADTDGAWRIVDYKSDRIGESPSQKELATHSAHHELQMRIYAAAATRQLGAPPAEAVLYYLRHGQTHAIQFDAAAIASVETELGQLAERLIVARRSGEFAAERTEGCEYCAYRAVCGH
ncbi:hypothetical protein LCGC14_0489900 [marine sediment metagenome]|uniref:DNA 3'-5' helicase n=1 Tax=marine sediment metagenome TaxID=412755 RepID=A0A0F9SQ52_9ZZZZ